MGRARRKIYGIDAVNIFKKGNLLHFLEQLGADDLQSKLWYGDATVKQDLYVEGNISGTFSADSLLSQSQDFKIHKDLVVQDDATVKNQITVEGQGTTYKGMTTDITAAGMKYRVVNGLIVEAVQKAWA